MLRIDNETRVNLGSKIHGAFLLDVEAPVWPDAGKPLASARTKNIWQMYNPKILVTQVVDIIPGRQPVEVKPGEWRWEKDTCLAAWLIENKDAFAHFVGLRIVLKVKAGDKVGMHFAAPGWSEPITDQADLSGAKIPLFLQDTEAADLHQPGTIAHANLKAGGDLEPPSNVMLTAWSNDQPRDFEMPLKHMGVSPSVVLIWQDKLMQPGEKRYLGFTWGLNHVVATPQKANTPQLGVSVEGTFAPGKEFTVFAQVRDWESGLKLELDLEPGLKLVQGKAEQAVPQPVGSTHQPRQLDRTRGGSRPL